MRKDVKTGMLIGTGLCLAVAVWFCIHQQVVEQPRIEDLLPRQSLATDTSPKTNPADAVEQVIIGKKPPALPPSAGETESLRIHIVQPGETLSNISKIYFGSNGNWKKIYEANKDSLPQGPDTIRTGMKLIIPQ